MTPHEREQALHALLEAALDLAPDRQRAFLEQACADDALRAEAEAMLALDRHGASPLDHSPLAAPTPAAAPNAGDRVGPYRLLRELGRGGMGVVFLAERADDAFEKQVAVKLLKPELAAGAFARRFQEERRILARLDHPNIARLLDGGGGAEGRPYLVMELVAGEPITGYCARLQLPIAQRLALFRKVCAAVHEAHRSLAIHRDLKPANILVDAEGEPKLLDFGIAKLLRSDSDQPATVTEWRPMTPEYASPEQLEGRPLTTASDIYALGVLLYELLTGARPRDLVNGAEKRVNAEPAKPSHAVSRRGVAGSTAEKKQWRRRLAGDLDTITLKALRLEPQRRYASAAQLAEDIDRHLAGFPVAARKDTFFYRLGKFTRRHKAALAAAALAAIAGVILQVAHNMALGAEQRQTERALQRAERVAELTIDVFALSDPYYQGKPAATMRELLDQAARKVREELAEEPGVKARLLDTLGEAYANAGLYRQAAPMLEEALTARRRALGPDAPETLASLSRLGGLLEVMGQYERAELLLQQSLSRQEACADVSVNDLALGLNRLGRLRRDQSHYHESASLHSRAVAILSESPQADPAILAESLHELARCKNILAEHDQAEPLFRRALALKESIYGPRHPEVGQSLLDLALFQFNINHSGAKKTLMRALSLLEETLDSEHPQMARCLVKMAEVKFYEHEYEEAKRLCERAIDMQVKAFGADHATVGLALLCLSRIDYQRQDYQVLEARFSRVFDIFKRINPEHVNTAAAMVGLAICYEMDGRVDEAEALHRRALNIRIETFGLNHPDTARTLSNLGFFLNQQGRCAEAETAYRQSLAGFQASLGTDNLSLVYALFGLGGLLHDSGRLADAEALYWETIDLIERRGDDHYRKWAYEVYAERFRLMNASPQAARLANLAKDIRFN